MRPLLAAIALLALAGCVQQPIAGPSSPVGSSQQLGAATESATSAQSAADTAADERLGKLRANVDAIVTAPNVEASPVALNEGIVAQGRLADVPPDPTEVAAAAERRALVESGRAEEARRNALVAAEQGRKDSAELAQLREQARKLAEERDNLAKELIAQAERNRVENQKAIDAALAAAKKARDEQQNAMLQAQGEKLTWIGTGCISAAILSAVGIGFFGSLLVLRKLAAYLIALAAVGFLFLGAAQIITQPWFMWVCAGVILFGAAWAAIWAWRHQKRGDLAEELAKRGAGAKATLDKLVPTIDAVYREGTKSIEEIAATLKGGTKATMQELLDAVLFQPLSSKLDKPEKDTVKTVRESTDPITL